MKVRPPRRVVLQGKCSRCGKVYRQVITNCVPAKTHRCFK